MLSEKIACVRGSRKIPDTLKTLNRSDKQRKALSHVVQSAVEPCVPICCGVHMPFALKDLCHGIFLHLSDLTKLLSH